MNRWVCLRCYESNEDSAPICVKCGLLRGSMPPAEAPEQAQAWSPISPPKPGMLGGLLRRFAWVGVVAAFAIGAAIFNAQRDDTGQITKGGTLAINELRVGDCFDPKDLDAEEANEVNVKRCDENHHFELMFAGAMEDGAYPTETQFEDFVGAACLPAFDAYVGLAYEESRLEVYWYFPVEDAWGSGDHLIQCAVYDPLDSTIVGSLRGAAY
jgi:hypothetical protein